MNFEYKPSIEYKKNYYSDGEFDYDEDIDIIPEEESEENSKETILTETEKVLEDTKILVNKLPEFIKESLPIITVVDKIISNIEKDDFIENPKQDEIIVEKDNDKTKVPEINEEDLLFPITDIEIDYKVITKDEEIFIEEDYNYKIVVIINDYILEMRKVLSEFYQTLIILAQESGYIDYKNLLIAEFTNVKCKDEFLKDSAIRESKILDQDLRLYKKIYNIDSIATQLTKCKLYKELQKKYCKDKYEKENNYMTMKRNVFLSEEKKNLDKKYEESFFVLYKYLKSSVILFSENLKALLNIAEKKALLLTNEGGNKK